jgi:glycolate oxidase FAD binding subunit
VILDDLAAVCGPGFVRPAGPADAVAGAAARWVAAPGTARQLADVLGLAHERGAAVVPRGAGSKLDWGGPPAGVDIVLDTGRLAGLYQHAPAERVATVGAGTPLRGLQAALARSGQRVALDPGSADATVGGLLATHETGPLRLAHGAPRDLLLGARVARADGVVVRAGPRAGSGGGREAPGPEGAGRSLGRLMCGAYGTLGVLTEATLRLHPRPAARTWTLRSVGSPLEAVELVAAVRAAAAVEPAAVEVDLPRGGGTVAVLVEGSSAGTAARAAAAARLLGRDAVVTAHQPRWWGRYPFGGDDIALRLAVPPADLHVVAYGLGDAVGGQVPLRGSAAVGVVHAALPAAIPPDRVADALAAVRTILLARGGYCTVLRASPAVRAAADAWGPVPGLALMRRLKAELDPRGVLAPGRLPVG